MDLDDKSTLMGLFIKEISDMGENTVKANLSGRTEVIIKESLRETSFMERDF